MITQILALFSFFNGMGGTPAAPPSGTPFATVSAIGSAGLLVTASLSTTEEIRVQPSVGILGDVLIGLTESIYVTPSVHTKVEVI